MKDLVIGVVVGGVAIAVSAACGASAPLALAFGAVAFVAIKMSEGLKGFYDYMQADEDSQEKKEEKEEEENSKKLVPKVTKLTKEEENSKNLARSTQLSNDFVQFNKEQKDFLEGEITALKKRQDHTENKMEANQKITDSNLLAINSQVHQMMVNQQNQQGHSQQLTQQPQPTEWRNNTPVNQKELITTQSMFPPESKLTSEQRTASVTDDNFNVAGRSETTKRRGVRREVEQTPTTNNTLPSYNQ